MPTRVHPGGCMRRHRVRARLTRSLAGRGDAGTGPGRTSTAGEESGASRSRANRRPRRFVVRQRPPWGPARLGRGGRLSPSQWPHRDSERERGEHWSSASRRCMRGRSRDFRRARHSRSASRRSTRASRHPMRCRRRRRVARQCGKGVRGRHASARGCCKKRRSRRPRSRPDRTRQPELPERPLPAREPIRCTGNRTPDRGNPLQLPVNPKSEMRPTPDARVRTGRERA